MGAMVARMDESEQQISDTEDKHIENNEAEKKKKGRLRHKENYLRMRKISDSLKEQHQNHMGPRR